MDEPGQESEVMDPAAAAPLLDAVWGPDPELRNAALPALVRLPLSESTWQAVRRYAEDTLSQHSTRPRDDVLAVIEASPWIPFSDTRTLAERVAVDAFAADEDARPLVLRALDQQRRITGLQATTPTPGPGFVITSAADREQVRESLSLLTDDQLWSQLGDQWGEGDQTHAAFVVTHLLETAGRRFDLFARYRVMEWVADRGLRFQPDLEGLGDEFVRHLDRLPDDREEVMARQVAWVISRGGLMPLLEQLRPQLESQSGARRPAAFQLVRYSAAYVDEQRPPADLSGRERGSTSAPNVVIDEDVQFTLYRPSRVRPEVWYSMLAFAHRTDPTTDASGQVFDPIAEVEQRAERLLATSPGSFDVLRADSASGLRRGTDLCFQPWIEVGEINPAQQSLRWEESVHQVEFRVRVPTSADGRRLQGGMRVFAGPILLAEIAFRLPVSSESTVGPTTNERDTARRFRQIFASYSHRDAAVVDAVQQYVTVTGDRYLIDARTLRSGEVWDERLRQMIDEADIFQLFWSRNSMNSMFVKQEWEYALQLGREGFVRPVFWENPLAEDPDRDLPPDQLRRLHFSWLGAPPPVVDDPPQVICARCGFANPTDVSFCERCGAFLEWSGAAAQPGTVTASTPPPATPAAPVAPAPPTSHSPAGTAVAAPARRPSHKGFALGIVAALVAIVGAAWWIVR